MRAWLPYVVLITLAASFAAVWQWGFNGVDFALIVKPPPTRIAPPDMTKRVSIQARQKPLDKVLAEFARQAEITIEFDASALAMPGLLPTTPVDFYADDLPVDQAVQLAVGTAACEVRVHDGKLLVVDPTAWNGSEKVEPRIYPLGPLLTEAEGLSAKTLVEGLDGFGGTFDPDSSGNKFEVQQLPAALLVTEKPSVHGHVEELFALLRRHPPPAGDLRQSHWVISRFAPSNEIMERLEEPVDLDLVGVPASQLAAELERQWKLAVRSQHAVTNTSKWLNGTKFTLHARQKPMQEVLEDLSSGQQIGWALHGEVLWLFDYGSDVLEAGPWASVFPIGDLLAAMDHPRTPLVRSELAQWFATDSYRSDSGFLIGNSLLVLSDVPLHELYADDQLRALRKAVFGGPEQAFDWRGYVELDRRLQQEFNVVCNQPKVSERLAQLAELSGVSIELAPELDRSTCPPTSDSLLEPIGTPFSDVLPLAPGPIPPWTFANDNLHRLGRYLWPLDLMVRRDRNGLSIVPRDVTSGLNSDEAFIGSHSLHAMLTAAGDRMTTLEMKRLLCAVSGLPEDEPVQMGAVFHLTGAGNFSHAAAAEMLEKLCDHARRPDDRTPWKIESIGSRIVVYPIGDVREAFGRLTHYYGFEIDVRGIYAGEPIADYLIADASPGEPAFAEQLLAALRNPRRQSITLKTGSTEPWQTRGLVLCDKWYRGFGSDDSFPVLYYAPELARLNKPLVESLLPEMDSQRLQHTYSDDVSGTMTLSSPAANVRLWHNFGSELTHNGRENALQALVGVHAGSDGYRVYGDHVAVMTTPAAQARFERRWRQITEPELLSSELPTMTLQAKDETLLAALDRWSRAERRPIVILDTGDVRTKLEKKITLDIQAQPLKEFVRQHLNDDFAAADNLAVRDDDGALLIAPRSNLDGDPAGMTRLFDLRPLRRKLPEMDGRQLVQLLVELMGHAAWNSDESNGSRAANLFMPRIRSLTPVGDVLIVRQCAEVVAEIETFLQRLASDEIDRLPRPALLFADEPAEAVEQYLTALSSSSSDELMVAYSAFWLTECATLDADQLAPLIEAFTLLDPITHAPRVQAICRVLAAHRGSAHAALEPLVTQLERTGPDEVYETLLATLACLGEDAIVPLAEMLADSDSGQSQQIVRHLWFFDEAAAPAVPLILEWAFLTDDPDPITCRGIFSSRGGLLQRADPKAKQTRAILPTWTNHEDAKRRAAYLAADKFFKQWPAYQDALAPYNWKAALYDPPFDSPVNDAFWREEGGTR
jgi:hypothetical protein